MNDVRRRQDQQVREMPRVSVVIGTRDRGTAIARTIESVQRSTLADWELLIVDQSQEDATETAVRPFADSDARVRYVRSTMRGTSAARNVGIEMARAVYIAVTDDDCEVAADWLAVLVREFEADSSVGFIAGALEPIAYDASTGYIPHFLPARRAVVERPWPITECFGASIALRRSALERAGLFDELIGPGALFPSLEEQDLCHRVLLAGYRAVIAPDAQVLHYGLRQHAELPRLWKRDARGIGGCFAKELRCGDVHGLTSILGFWGQWIGVVGKNVMTGRRPLKLRQAGAYMWHSALGFAQGLAHPVAAQRHVYLPQRWLVS